MRQLSIALAVCLFLGLAFGAALAADEPDYAAAGFTLAGTTTEDQRDFANLQDGAGNVILVSSDQPLSDDSLSVIKGLKERIFAIAGLQVAQFKVVVTEGRYDVLVSPKAFQAQGVDFLAYLPSGLQFQYSSYIEYNFRMKVGKSLVKIEGTLLADSGLVAEMLEAVKDPVAYIKKRNQDEIANKVQALEADLAIAKTDLALLKSFVKKLATLDPKAIKRIAELKAKNPAVSAEEAQATLKREGMSLSLDDVKLALSAL
jgi:hypothetical protein